MQPVLVLWIGLFIIYLIVSGGAETILDNFSRIKPKDDK